MMTIKSKLLTAGGVLLLVVVLAMGIMAWRAKARADLYRARVEVLEEAVSRMRDEAVESDRQWKAKLSDAETRYREAEKRRKEAAAEFSKWKPAGFAIPKSTDELVSRFKNAGVRAVPREVRR